MISILCAQKNSTYKTIPGLDVWDSERDAYFFTGSNPVITHAPCQQWSRLRAFATPNADEKELAYFCLNKVIRNGGIFEHPMGSSFFKEAGVEKNIYSVDQSWWGFPCRKTTYLFFHKVKPLPFPVLQNIPTKVLGVYSGLSDIRKKERKELSKKERSTTVLSFAQYLINCIENSNLMKSKNFKYLVVNHTRKTFHFSNNDYCYREHTKDGREVTEHNESFTILNGERSAPKGYKNDME